MKKCLLIAALALATLTTNAQTLALSTYSGTDISKYDGQTRNVTVNRYVFSGWNTIALPFDLSTEMLNETFGQDCRLEKLVGVESNGTQTQLNFMDCKNEGLKANTPYILYYTGESSNKKIIAQDALLLKGNAEVTFCDVNGVEVKFAGAQTHRSGEGLYGIKAINNSEAAFVSTDGVANGFYATRCFIQLSNGTATQLTTNHLSSGEATSIASVLRTGEKADVYSISGTRIASNLSQQEISNLPAGVYVINGRKISVK